MKRLWRRREVVGIEVIMERGWEWEREREREIGFEGDERGVCLVLSRDSLGGGILLKAVDQDAENVSPREMPLLFSKHHGRG